MGSFYSCEKVTVIIEGIRRSGMEEVVSFMQLFYFVFTLRENLEKKQVHMRLRRELNVYEY